MDYIRFLRTARVIEREAAARGYRGDILSDDAPLVGTLRQQMAIAALGCDTSPGPMSTRDRELHGRLVRAAVLCAPADEPAREPAPQPPARPARRRVV